MLPQVAGAPDDGRCLVNNPHDANNSRDLNGPHDPNDDGRNETPNMRADRNWNEILQELRVAQTGTQILGGFLLAVAFQSRFTELDDYQLGLYLVLVALACVATALGLAPVSLHRMYFGRGEKERIVRIGSRLLVADLVAVAALASGVTSLIFDLTVSRMAGLIALASACVLVVLLWTVMPKFSRRSPLP